jgi:hypothetical protein
MRPVALHLTRQWLLAVVIAGRGAMHAQETVADTSAVDSARSRIIPGIGSSIILSGRTVAQRDGWLWMPFRSVEQVLDHQAGRFVRSLGEAGAGVGTSWLGGASSHDGWSLDGLPMDDPLTRRPDLSLVPLEQQESIEQRSDEEATLAGSRWNLVTRQFSTVRPITAVRFVQEPDETLLSDAFFAQNIARSTALTLGFQRHTSAGRFTNAALDAWNLRGRVRTNLSQRLNLAVMWGYGRSSRGVNGGVDPVLSQSVFDDVSAIVVHSSGYEIRERTDLGMTGILRPFDDSLATTRIGVIGRRVEREYQRPPDPLSTVPMRQFARTRDLFVSIEQRAQLPLLLVAASAQYGSTRLDSTEVLPQRTATRSRLSLAAAVTLLEWLSPRAAVAIAHDDGDRALEASASISVAALKGLQTSISVAQRPMFPTLQERFWSDSTVLRPTMLGRGDEHQLTAEVSWHLDTTLTLRAMGFQRKQRNVVIVRPAATVHGTPSVALTTWSPSWSGLAASGRVSMYGFEVIGSFTWTAVEVADTLRQILPRWWGSAELAYQGRLFRDQLGIRTGVRTRFSDRLRGLSPDPPTGLEVVNTTTLIGRAATVDLYGTMEIGQAFVTLSWENLTNASTLRTAIYPMPGRQFKLGVRWMFAD